MQIAFCNKRLEYISSVSCELDYNLSTDIEFKDIYETLFEEYIAHTCEI